MVDHSQAAASARSLGAGAKVFLIIKREFLERVRTKAFIISTLLVPVFLGLVMFAPLLLSRLTPDKPLKLAVFDLTGELFQDLDNALAADPTRDFLNSKDSEEKIRRYQLELEGRSAPDEDLTAKLHTRIEDEDLDSYLVIPANIGEADVEASYYGKSVSNIEDLRRLRTALSEVMVARRLSAEGVDPAKTAEITRRTGLDTVKLGAKGEQARRGVGEELIVIMVYTMFIYINILIYGTALTRSLIEEKMNRVSEILLSSMTPFQLMVGKIVGIGSVGLTQFLIWATAAVGLSSLQGGGSGDSAQILDAVDPVIIAYFVLYFVLGYFLYASLFCIVGAMCTSEQEAQNTQTPVVMTVVVSLILGMSLMRQPTSTLTVAISHIPFLSPIVMFMRVQALTPSPLEIILNIITMCVFILLTAWLAGRIFRVGILMTGKKPTIPELIRWIRTT
jgi:ABC-2 type transport system permease protein